MVSEGEKNVIIDTGPDFRQQMLREKVKSIEGVVFTHEHKDHIAGLDDVRAFNFLLGREIPVYCTDRVAEALQREFAYAFSDTKYPGIPEIRIVLIDARPFRVSDIPFLPIEVLHMKLPVNGYRIGDFTYITDANYISDEEKEKLAGTKILVLNALRRKKHPSHFTLDEAVELAKEVGAETTYLTHISHQLGKHQEIVRELPAGIKLASDGLKITIESPENDSRPSSKTLKTDNDLHL